MLGGEGVAGRGRRSGRGSLTRCLVVIGVAGSTLASVQVELGELEEECGAVDGGRAAAQAFVRVASRRAGRGGRRGVRGDVLWFVVGRARGEAVEATGGGG